MATTSQRKYPDMISFFEAMQEKANSKEDKELFFWLCELARDMGEEKMLRPDNDTILPQELKEYCERKKSFLEKQTEKFQ